LAIPLSRCAREVIAVEANPVTYDLSKMNSSLNSATNIQAINDAASDKEEDIEFLFNRDNSGGSKRVPKVKKHIYQKDLGN
jgi:FkbM family methyltransferase